MRFAFFAHSAVSDWNHGNAHFLRGLMSALVRGGHSLVCWEPRGAWSVQNLLADHGMDPIVRFARAYPEIEVRSYDPASADLAEALEAACAGVDVAMVHEWNDPHVVNAIPAIVHARGGLAIFHDTHHRPWSQPEAIARFDLAAYDGVLAFGDVLRDVYHERFGVQRAWTFHEAADHVRFRPLRREKQQDVVWIGNWGDEERTQELRDFWLSSARQMPELKFVAHGVRYPGYALAELADAGVEFRGWAQSIDVPEIFARSRATLHVPRRAYVQALAGIPTIRVFEALACGIPLVCAPWDDAERLFRAGDYAVAHTPAEMCESLRRLCADEEAARAQAERGLETILARHTCEHRAAQLLDIIAELGTAGSASSSAEAVSDRSAASSISTEAVSAGSAGSSVSTEAVTAGSAASSASSEAVLTVAGDEGDSGDAASLRRAEASASADAVRFGASGDAEAGSAVTRTGRTAAEGTWS